MVVASIRSTPEGRAALLEAATANLAAVRAEDGCQSYRFFEEVGVPGSFVFVEEWRDSDAFRAHAASEHMRVYAQRTAALVASRHVAVHEVAATRTF